MSMLKGVRPFQIALYGTFFIFGVIGLIVFNMGGGRSGDEVPSQGSVVIWGPFERRVVNPIIRQINEEVGGFDNVTYTQVNASDLNSRLVNALADRVQPDLVIMPHTNLVQLRSRLWPIPYNVISSQHVRDTYLDGFEIFTLSNGVYGIPLVVDPLVMYWNRDIFATNALVSAPKTWEALTSDVFPLLIRRDFDRSVLQSVVALGHYHNNKSAFASISTLLMQAGSLMVTESSGEYSVNLNRSPSEAQESPLTNTIEYYMRFGSSDDSLFSWSRNEVSDESAFLRGSLAMYFGMGSEYRNILDTNPNLNFAVASVPQPATANVKRVYADFYTIAIVNQARNRVGAYNFANTLSNPRYTSILANATRMVPAHRSLVSRDSTGVLGSVTYESAVYARGWLNPTKRSTESILRDAIQDVTSGRLHRNSISQTIIEQLRRAY